MLRLELFQDKYLGAAIELLQRSDSTDRTFDTWRGNNMTAVLAFDGDKLVGIIPFEQRAIAIKEHETVKALWVSGAHVDSEYRSHGLGSRMDHAVDDYFAKNFDCVLVCRGDEASGAYRWYKKNGYEDLAEIISFKKGMVKSDTSLDYLFFESLDDIEKNQQKLYDCFWRNNLDYCGFVNRDKNFWHQRCLYHYYKKFYHYSVLALPQGKDISAYAFLGKTAMRDNIGRYDLLELVVPQDDRVKNDLFSAIMALAGKKGLSEIRVQIAGDDPVRNWVEANGFLRRWDFKVMGRPIAEKKPLNEIFNIHRWRYFHLDYI